MDIVDLLYGSISIQKEDNIVTIRCLNDDNKDSVLSFEISDDCFEYYENIGVKSPSINIEYIDKFGVTHTAILFLTHDCRLLTFGENSSDILELKLLVNKEMDPFNEEGLDDFFTYCVKRGISDEKAFYYLFSLDKYGDVIRKTSKPYEKILLSEEYNMIQGERLNHFDLISLNGTLQLEGLEEVHISATIKDENDKEYFILIGIIYDGMYYTFMVDSEIGGIISFLDSSINKGFIDAIIRRYKVGNPSVRDGNVLTGNFRKF